MREECKRIPILEAEIAIKDAKISELEKRLNLNSKNSHLPPSRDNSKTKSEKKAEDHEVVKSVDKIIMRL